MDVPILRMRQVPQVAVNVIDGIGPSLHGDQNFPMEFLLTKARLERSIKFI